MELKGLNSRMNFIIKEMEILERSSMASSSSFSPPLPWPRLFDQKRTPFANHKFKFKFNSGRDLFNVFLFF